MNQTQTYDAIVIGAGLSGLSCALTLLKEGYTVCVIEKERNIGGAFQSFRRGEVQLETGFHYVGGVNEGEMMNPLVKYFELEHLPWVRLDAERFEDVYIRGKKFQYRNGYDNFQADLTREFPDDAQGIIEFVDVLRHINNHMYDSIDPNYNIMDEKYFSISAYEFLNTHIQSQLLRDVLCGGSITTELTEELPLYSFVQSINSFVQGSYKIEGGGQKLIDCLADNVKKRGGVLYAHKEVSSFVLDDQGLATGVVCDDEVFHARLFVSTIHPTLTVQMIPETPVVRNVYRRRMNNLQNTIGMFTTQLQIKKETLLYVNRAICIHNSTDLWHNQFQKDSPVEELLINYSVPDDGSSYVRNIDLLTPMSWKAVQEWSDTSLGHRPESYKQFKKEKAQASIDLAKQYVPGLEDAIERVWTSTPLTYRDYTGTIQGSAYGVRKSSKALLSTVLSPMTPVKNLYLSGQNMTLHGMLGVLMTTLRTCGQIIGKKIKL